MRTRPLLAGWMAQVRDLLRPRPGRMAAGALLSLLLATTLWAQEAEGGGGTIIQSGRSWIIEAVIVGVMVALALYVVCRSSRRQ